MPTPVPSVRLCGVPRIEGPDGDVTVVGRQPWIALAVLALAPEGAPVTREALVDAVWDDRPPRDPGAALRPVLSRLRAALGAEAIAGRESLRLTLDAAQVDILGARAATRDAAQALAAGDAATAHRLATEAARLTAGGLLPGFDGEALVRRRWEVDELRDHALELRARAAVALRLPDAVDAATELIARSPLRESAHLAAIEAHLALGAPNAAAQAFERLRTVLRDELGTVPSPAARAAHARALGAVDLPQAPPLPGWLPAGSSVPALVGRDADLARLREAWTTPGAGGVLLSGEPGIGKTWLLTAFARSVAEPGVTVLGVRCEQRAARALAPVAQLVASLPEELRSASDDDGVLARVVGLEEDAGPRTSAAAFQERLRGAVGDAVDALASRTRVLLLVEDLHWADDASTSVLEEVVRRLARTAGLVLLSARGGELPPSVAQAVADLRRDELLAVHPLEGLDVEAVATYLATTPDRAQAVHARTAGNPLWLRELRRHGLDADTLPDGVRALVAARVLGLEPGTRTVLRRAAVLGPHVSGATVAAMGEDGIDATFDRLEAATASGFLAPDDQGFAFVHAIVREAILADVPPERQRTWHGAAAAALEAREPDRVVEIADHLLCAGAPRAAAAALTAADRLDATHGWLLARDLLERAAAGAPDDGDRGRLLARAAEMAWRGGDSDGASRLRRTAVPLALATDDHALLTTLALEFDRYPDSGPPDPDDVQLLEDTLARLPVDDHDARAGVRARLAMLNAHDHATDAIVQADAAATPPPGSAAARYRVALARAYVRGGAGSATLEQRLQLADELEAAGRAAGVAEAESLVAWFRWFGLSLAGDGERCRVAAATLVDATERLRQSFMLLYPPFLTALERVRSGDDGDLPGLVEEIVAAARMRSDATNFASGLLIFAHRTRGDMATLAPPLETGETSATMPALVEAALAVALAAAGRREEATASLTRLAAGGWPAHRGDWYEAAYAHLCAEGCFRAGADLELDVLEARLAPLTGTIVHAQSIPFGPADHGLAWCAGARGDTRAALAHLDAAERAATRWDAPALAAWAARDRALLDAPAASPRR